MDALRKLIDSKREEVGGRRYVRQSEILARNKRKTQVVDDDVVKEPEVEREKKKQCVEKAIPPTKEKSKEESVNDIHEENELIRTWIQENIIKWERKLSERSEKEASSAHGKVERSTFQQCKEHLKPLLKLCKRNKLEISMRSGLAGIIRAVVQDDFVKAHDLYLLIAIGNAAWPIGVTSVGIHTRTAREHLEQRNVAHVMNNEMQRKFLTSFKRLLRFAQDLRPDLPPSQKVLG